MDAIKRALQLASIVVADAAVLLWLCPNWRQLARDLCAPHAWMAQVGADQAALVLATAALWCVALWLAVGLSAALAAAMPGRVGAMARAIADRLLPAVLLRAVAGVAGLGVLVAPVAAGAHTPTAGRTAGAALAAAAPAPGWPTDPHPAPHMRIGWPTDAPPAPIKPRDVPRMPNRSAPNADATAADQADRSPGAGGVRVKPGDSLWLIAAQRLGPDASDAGIAAAWPRWYAANERVIGDDPALIQPGQVLHAPSND